MEIESRREGLSDAKRALLEKRLKGTAPAVRQRELVTRVAGPGPEHPASFAQERMWFLTQFTPGNPMYNVPVAVLVSAALDVSVLERAITEVVRRHEGLRTTFHMVDGELRQRVHEPFPVRVEVREARDRVGQNFGHDVDRMVAKEGSRPFDLSVLPLFRVTLLRVSDADYALVITMQHIVIDGWAYPLVLREIEDLYNAFLAGRPSPFPEPALRYADFAVWQRKYLTGATLDAQVSYWRGKLAGAPVLDLPLDFPRPPVFTYRGRFHRFRVPGRIVERVRALCREEAVTMNMVLMAAFYVLLQKHSGQDDLVVGTLLGNRNRAELEQIVGVFVNTAAVRMDLSGDPTFRALVRASKTAVLEADRHQDLPFERLVDLLGLERDLSRHPVFQALYFHHVFVRSHSGPTLTTDGPSGLESRPIAADHDSSLIDTGVSKFDLMMSTTEHEDFVAATIEYSTELYAPETIARLGRHFVLLLERAVAAPDAHVGRISLLDEDERALVVDRWNDTAREYDLAPIHRLIERRAALTPEAPAVTFEGETLTYAEMNARANRIARRLRALGVGAESRVGVCLERSADLVVSLLAVMKAGGAYVPLDPSYPAERLAYLAKDSAAPVVLADSGSAPKLPALDARVVLLDGEAASIEAEDGSDLGIDVDLDALAYVIYTSGSTGQPKGAMNAHRGVANRLLWMQEAFGLNAGEAVLQKTPFSFDVSVWELFWPLVVGARLVVARPEGHRDPAYLRDVIRAEGVTTLHFVPSMLRAFVEAGAFAGCDTLRRVVCSGEALPPDLRDRVLAETGAGLHNLYGPTEAAVDVSHHACGPADAGAATVPIGRPVANTRLYVLDGAGRPAPVGVPGELYIGGVQVGRGYLGRPGLTAERFVPDPFSPGARMYRTGDRARWLADGSLAYLGRLDDQVKLRGHRIELGEVEAAMAAHPAVRHAVAAVREDAPGQRRLVGYVVTEMSADEAAAELRVWLRERLPEVMVPTAFVKIDAVPLSPSGKADRRRLPAPDAGEARAAAYRAPRNADEEALARIWAGVLHRERIGIDDNFFELGGDSIHSIAVVARAASEAGLRLHPWQMFQHQTVAEQAAAAERIAPAGDAASADTAPSDADFPELDDAAMDAVMAQLGFEDE